MKWVDFTLGARRVDLLSGAWLTGLSGKSSASEEM